MGLFGSTIEVRRVYVVVVLDQAPRAKSIGRCAFWTRSAHLYDELVLLLYTEMCDYWFCACGAKDVRDREHAEAPIDCGCGYRAGGYVCVE